MATTRKARISALNCTWQECAALYSYDPHSGVFIVKRQLSEIYKVGSVRHPIMARSTSKQEPFPCLPIGNEPRKASHVAYLLMIGSLVPAGKAIFHLNGDRMDLRWANMVLAPQSCGGKLDGYEPLAVAYPI